MTIRSFCRAKLCPVLDKTLFYAVQGHQCLVFVSDNIPRTSGRVVDSLPIRLPPERKRDDQPIGEAQDVIPCTFSCSNPHNFAQRRKPTGNRQHATFAASLEAFTKRLCNAWQCSSSSSFSAQTALIAIFQACKDGSQAY